MENQKRDGPLTIPVVGKKEDRDPYQGRGSFGTKEWTELHI